MSKRTEQSLFKGRSPNGSTFLAIREMQIKTMLAFYLTLVRMATMKNINNNKY
jgi:hypothetical protein